MENVELHQIFEENINFNHLEETQSTILVDQYLNQFIEFPIHTKEGDPVRIEKIYDDIHDQGGLETMTWEQSREIDEEFGTTKISICVN